MRTFIRSAGPAVLIAALAACPRRTDETPKDAGGPDAGGLRRVEVGDRVVVESAIATFVEGTVSAVERDQAHIELAQGKWLDQPSSEIYVLARSSARPLPSAGSFAVCHAADGRWRGCRVDAALADDRVRVVDDELLQTEVGKSEVLSATPVSELNIRQRFDKNARRRAFREGAKTAVQPRVPSGWRPRFDEKVLARRDGRWVSARIKGLSKGVIRVLWEDTQVLSDTSIAEIGPQPPIDFVPTVGTYVLARHAPGARAWVVMRVESASQLSLVLSDEMGEPYQMAPRDVLPLDRGPLGE